MRGILVGAFALIVLQKVVKSKYSAGAVSGIGAGANKVIGWFLDPNTPAIPDRSKGATSSSSSSTTQPAPGGPGTPLNPYLPGVI
jgi:hypothetical protein